MPTAVASRPMGEKLEWVSVEEGGMAAARLQEAVAAGKAKIAKRKDMEKLGPTAALYALDEAKRNELKLFYHKIRELEGQLNNAEKGRMIYSEKPRRFRLKKDVKFIGKKDDLPVLSKLWRGFWKVITLGGNPPPRLITRGYSGNLFGGDVSNEMHKASPLEVANLKSMLASLRGEFEFRCGKAEATVSPEMRAFYAENKLGEIDFEKIVEKDYEKGHPALPKHDKRGVGAQAARKPVS